MDQLHVTMDVPLRSDHIRAAVEGLAASSTSLMRAAALAGSEYPALYDGAGIKYRREPPGAEDWQAADKLLASGEGDCEDLAGYRVGELRVHGENASVEVTEMAPGKYHARVRRGDGSIEDPSLILIRLEKQGRIKPKMPKLKMCVKDLGTHVMGAIQIPLKDGSSIEVAELGFDPWSAISNAATTVMNVITDPVVDAALPPWAGAAIQVAKRIIDMSSGGQKALSKDPRATDAQKALAKTIADAKAKWEARTQPAPAPAPDYSDMMTNDYWTGHASTPSVGAAFPIPGGISQYLPPSVQASYGAVRPAARPVTVTVTGNRSSTTIPGQVTAMPPVTTTAPYGYPQMPQAPYGYPPPPQAAPYGYPYGYPQMPQAPYGYPPPPQAAPYGYPQMPPPQYGYAQPYQTAGYYPYYPYDQYGGYPPPMPPQTYVDPSSYQTAMYEQALMQQQQAQGGSQLVTGDDLLAMQAWGAGAFAPGSYPGIV